MGQKEPMVAQVRKAGVGDSGRQLKRVACFPHPRVRIQLEERELLRAIRPLLAKDCGQGANRIVG